jgi:hypothetical protein
MRSLWESLKAIRQACMHPGCSQARGAWVWKDRMERPSSTPAKALIWQPLSLNPLLPGPLLRAGVGEGLPGEMALWAALAALRTLLVLTAVAAFIQPGHPARRGNDAQIVGRRIKTSVWSLDLLMRSSSPGDPGPDESRKSLEKAFGKGKGESPGGIDAILWHNYYAQDGS